MTNNRATEISIDEMMERMADHLDSLASKVFEVEDALGKTLENQDPHNGDSLAITRLQSLDFLRQSLEDLALLTCMVSKNADLLEEKKFLADPIAEGLKLDTTRFVLMGRDNTRISGASNDTGDLDLF